MNRRKRGEHIPVLAAVPAIVRLFGGRIRQIAPRLYDHKQVAAMMQAAVIEEAVAVGETVERFWLGALEDFMLIGGEMYTAAHNAALFRGDELRRMIPRETADKVMGAAARITSAAVGKPTDVSGLMVWVKPFWTAVIALHETGDDQPIRAWAVEGDTSIAAVMKWRENVKAAGRPAGALEQKTTYLAALVSERVASGMDESAAAAAVVEYLQALDARGLSDEAMIARQRVLSAADPIRVVRRAYKHAN